uniref:Uncharacterized protein n=1 Tax=Oryza sativa subsp. japonica TaxID=39947 RepID=Q5Z587_ORYSJ|nr:hypothetical protein [Oryza sativa Japonica Group]BAD69394.1 hypothetical protein [Oryza sativa Japonica Group]
MGWAPFAITVSRLLSLCWVGEGACRRRAGRGCGSTSTALPTTGSAVAVAEPPAVAVVQPPAVTEPSPQRSPSPSPRGHRHRAPRGRRHLAPPRSPLLSLPQSPLPSPPRSPSRAPRGCRRRAPVAAVVVVVVEPPAVAVVEPPAVAVAEPPRPSSRAPRGCRRRRAHHGHHRRRARPRSPSTSPSPPVSTAAPDGEYGERAGRPRARAGRVHKQGVVTPFARPNWDEFVRQNFPDRLVLDLRGIFLSRDQPIPLTPQPNNPKSGFVPSHPTPSLQPNAPLMTGSQYLVN